MKLYQKIGFAGALMLISCSTQKGTDEFKDSLCKDEIKTAVQEALHDVQLELWQAESQIYLSEGFEFTPGGGYWFYPNGMKNLSAQQRDEISKRLELRTAGLSKLEKKLDVMEEKYK